MDSAKGRFLLYFRPSPKAADWPGCCSFATRMRTATPLFNRRTRAYLHVATACLSLLLWMFLTAAEACTPLHAWIHGGSIPDNDDCAVAVAAHGKVDSAPVVVPAVAPVTWVEVAPRIETSAFSPVIAFLPDGRGPPTAFSSLA